MAAAEFIFITGRWTDIKAGERDDLQRRSSWTQSQTMTTINNRLNRDSVTVKKHVEVTANSTIQGLFRILQILRVCVCPPTGIKKNVVMKNN